MKFELSKESEGYREKYSEHWIFELMHRKFLTVNIIG